MKFGIRTPSLSKRLAARTSVARVVRHSLGFKAPRGYGWVTNPKRAVYNRVYNRTTVKADGLIVLLVMGVLYVVWEIIVAIFSLFKKPEASLGQNINTRSIFCPRCSADMILRNGKRGQFFGCSRFPRCRGTREHDATQEIHS